VSQVPRSIIWHLSEQNGRKRFRCDSSAGFLQVGQLIAEYLIQELSDEGVLRNEAALRSGIANDARNLTPNPFPRGKGDNRGRDWRTFLRAIAETDAYGMIPRWTKTLPLGPMRTQLMSVRLNSGVQSG
jgi:hypothetical protein